MDPALRVLFAVVANDGMSSFNTFAPDNPKKLETLSVKICTKTFVSVIALALGIVGTARADLIPYPNAGSINYTTYTFTAVASGDVTVYYTGSGDATGDSIGMLDNGVSTGVFGLYSLTTPVGTSLDLGAVNSGDVITFELLQTLNYGLGGYPAVRQIFSDPTLNATYDNQNHGGAALPGFNHVYAANYTATGDVAPADDLPGIPLSAGIPAGVYVGFEGNPIPGNPNYFSTDDYNSFTFVATDVTIGDPTTDGSGTTGGGTSGVPTPDNYTTAGALGLTLTSLALFLRLTMAAKKS